MRMLTKPLLLALPLQSQTPRPGVVAVGGVRVVANFDSGVRLVGLPATGLLTNRAKLGTAGGSRGLGSRSLRGGDRAQPRADG